MHHFLNDFVALGWVPGLNIVVVKEGQVVYQGLTEELALGKRLTNQIRFK